MVERNQDSLKTAYTITVDYKHGTTTGISAADRSKTIQALADPSSTEHDFNRPGHVFPLAYHEGGVEARPGHTEAGVDFCILSGKEPCACISEIVLDNGQMARRNDLMMFAKRHGLKFVTIADLIQFKKSSKPCR
jgi:3,4-dihydroxy 2-butanone 4-phosphate synthase/GTP cyclohydrolase II